MSQSDVSLVADVLVEAGARRAFVVASVHNLRLLEALDAAGIDCIPTASEVGAGHMADGHARATGELSVLVTSTGPGAGNAAGTFGTAAKDGSRVLHLSTTNVVDRASGLHHVPEQGLWMTSHGSPFVDVTRDGIEALREMLRTGGPAAATLSWSGESGPLARQEAQPVETAGALPLTAATLAPWLQAERPLLWIGGGARSISSDRLVQIAERAGAPVITTIQGKDLFPSDHPLYLGTTLHQAEVRDAAATRDVCLAIGSRMASTSAYNWASKLCDQVIRTGLTPELPPFPDASVSWIRAGSQEVVVLLETVLRGAPRSGDGQALAAEVQARRRAKRTDEGAHALLGAIRGVLRRGDVVVCDMTKLSFWALLALDLPRDVAWQFPGLLTMGFGLPAALGASVGRPDNHVLLIVGDGGLRSILQELDTARAITGRVSIVLADDDGYFLLRPLMQDAIGASLCETTGPDWRGVIGGMGLAYSEVTDGEELGKALREPHEGVRVIRLDARQVGNWREA